MEKRSLGGQGLEVCAVGLGCMGMSWAYGKSEEPQCIRVLHHALDIGVNFWDTAEVYGPFTNEELLGRALKGKRREDVIIATKFAFKDWTAAPQTSSGRSKDHSEGWAQATSISIISIASIRILRSKIRLVRWRIS